jgi:hypothetical protein
MTMQWEFNSPWNENLNLLIQIKFLNLFLYSFKQELWVTSLSDTPHLQYYDDQTLEYRYISKLIMSPSKF